MNKKQDLKLVFEFIAEFLREEEVTPTKASEPKISIPEPIDEPIEEAIDEPKRKLEKLFNPQDVRHLMQRVDDMDKVSPFSNPILGEQQRNFEVEFKKMVSEVDKLTKEKEANDRDKQLEATAKSDFDIIKEGRNNVSSEEREALRPSYDSLKKFMDRAQSGISFSG